MASNQEQTKLLIQQLQELGDDLSSNEARQQALQLSRKITASLEHPEKVAVEMGFQPMIPSAVRIGIDLDVFKVLAESDGPVGIDELVPRSKGDAQLIIRIMRMLSSIGFVNEVGERKWSASPITHQMAREEVAAGHRMLADTTNRAANAAPRFFAEHGYHNPTDPLDGLIQYAFQTKLPAFELFRSIPQIFADFNTFMGHSTAKRSFWTDWYPVQEQILDGFDPETALMVDVGGGEGHDLQDFHKKIGDGKGRLVLQDLPAVLEAAEDLGPSIEVMQHDFFTEQPVKGARVYFYHHILHDWPDKSCAQILQHVRQAMTPGYSKLLLHEMILPETNASTFHSMLDMTMMAFNGGSERTESHWRELLGEAGLELVKVWPALEEDGDGIVEAVVKT